MDISKIYALELKTVIIKTGLGTSTQGPRKSLTVDIKELISTQVHFKNAITEM